MDIVTTRPDDLLPCPFCGAKATAEVIGGGWYWIGCQEDDCDVAPHVDRKNMRLARETHALGLIFPEVMYEELKGYWNKRA